MKTNRAFWDASAIAPTCMHEADSPRAHQLLRKYPRQVVWWGTLLDDYPLRTGDALQLAAALISCNKNPRRRIFVCFDDRLAAVAEDVGFKAIKA
jgi:hypothetical protein